MGHEWAENRTVGPDNRMGWTKKKRLKFIIRDRKRDKTVPSYRVTTVHRGVRVGWSSATGIEASERFFYKNMRICNMF